MKPQRLSILVGAISLCALAPPADARPPKVETADAQEVKAAYRQPGTRVLAFAGN